MPSITMLNITIFGWFHTVLGLIAVFAGFAALLRHKEISLHTRAGWVFFWFTVATCITGFFIFRHGGFGKPHVLGIVTLVVLAVAWVAERRDGFGRLSRYVAAVSYLLALFFHFIPAYNEMLSRLPVGSPYISGPEDPKLTTLVGATFLVFLLGMVWQVLRIRGARRSASPGAGLA